jgi:hypothetical protein
MPYDTSLDKQVFSKSWENDEGRIVVSVHSYNNGPHKLQIAREFKDREGNYNITRLGRLSKEEIEAVLPLVQEAVKQM